MEQIIKDCPFCGTKASDIQIGTNGIYIECKGCGVYMGDFIPQKLHTSEMIEKYKLSLMERWNKRI